MSDHPELVAGNVVSPLIPRDLSDLAMIADAFIRAGMVPSSYEVKEGTRDDQAKGTKAKLMIGIMKGLEVGMGPVTALSNIFIVNNRPCVWGDGAVALAQRAGVVKKVDSFWEIDGARSDETPAAFEDALTAVCKIWRKDQPEPYVGRFSVLDAKRAHLWGNVKKAPWIQYPQRMLMARARAYALRDGFADALSGLSIREEIEDLPAEPKMVEESRLNELLGPNPPTDEDKPQTPSDGEEATSGRSSPAQEET